MHIYDKKYIFAITILTCLLQDFLTLLILLARTLQKDIVSQNQNVFQVEVFLFVFVPSNSIASTTSIFLVVDDLGFASFGCSLQLRLDNLQIQRANVGSFPDDRFWQHPDGYGRRAFNQLDL